MRPVLWSLTILLSVKFLSGHVVTSWNTSLTCYDCEDTFTDVWDPYTDCQVRLDRVDIKTCLSTEEYCLVERITVKKMTISIKRSCAKECWYGCRAKGFGVTQYMCTSCCRDPECNVGNGSLRTYASLSLTLLLPVLLVVRYRSTTGQ